MINKLSQAIDQAIQETINNGSAEVRVDKNVVIGAEWETYEGCPDYDVVGLYFYEDDIIKFSYQAEETKTKTY